MAIGRQVYDLTGSAFDLGIVGLVQLLPTALLVFVGGHAVDRYDRKRVVQLCQLRYWRAIPPIDTQVCWMFQAVIVFGAATSCLRSHNCFRCWRWRCSVRQTP